LQRQMFEASLTQFERYSLQHAVRLESMVDGPRIVHDDILGVHNLAGQNVHALNEGTLYSYGEGNTSLSYRANISARARGVGREMGLEFTVDRPFNKDKVMGQSPGSTFMTPEGLVTFGSDNSLIVRAGTIVGRGAEGTTFQMQKGDVMLSLSPELLKVITQDELTSLILNVHPRELVIALTEMARPRLSNGEPMSLMVYEHGRIEGVNGFLVDTEGLNLSRVSTPDEVRNGMNLDQFSNSLPLTGDFRTRFDSLSSDPRQAPVVHEIREAGLFEPVRQMSLGGDKILHLGKVIQSPGERPYSIAFVEEGGVLTPILYYKSGSNGVWRCSPYVKPDGALVKGATGNSSKSRHYTQETRPVDAVLSHLTTQESTPVITTRDVNLYLRVLPDESAEISRNYFENTVEYTSTSLEAFGILKEGKPVRSSGQRRRLESRGKEVVAPNKAAEFIRDRFRFAVPGSDQGLTFPDFTLGIKHQYSMNHTVLGDCTVRVFEGDLDGRSVEWHFASDADGRVWIDTIRFTDGESNAYGTYSEFINSGFLTSKPLEYRVQTYGVYGIDSLELSGGYHNPESYLDQTPLLDQLQPIQAFRAATGVQRTGSAALPSGARATG